MIAVVVMVVPVGSLIYWRYGGLGVRLILLPYLLYGTDTYRCVSYCTTLSIFY